jgi:outer membrane protein TolC
LKTINKKWTYLCLVLLILIGVRTNQAAEKTGKKAYTLEQLIQLFKQNNLLLKIAELDKRIAVEEYREVRVLPNPGVEYARGRGEIPGVPGNPEIRSMGLKWSMPNPIYRYFFLKSMRAHVKEAEIEAEMNKREILKNLKTHFYKLQLSGKIRTFLEEKLRILEEVSEITRAKVSIGESKEIDFLRSSVEIQKTKTALFRIQKTIAYERTSLNEFLAYTLPEDFTAVEDFSFTPLPDIEGQINHLIETSPFIRLKFTQLKRENVHLDAVRSSIIEEVEIFAEKEKEIEGEKWKIGIGVSIPLFNQKSAHIRKAKLQTERAQTEYRHAREHFFADIQRMAAEIRSLEKEIDTFKGAVLEEGRQNMELSEELYKEGEVPLVVFLDSQNSYFEVQERYYEALTEWNILKAELEALLGGDQ